MYVLGGGTRATFHHTVAVAQTIGELEAGGGGVVTGDSTKQQRTGEKKKKKNVILAMYCL